MLYTPDFGADQLARDNNQLVVYEPRRGDGQLVPYEPHPKKRWQSGAVALNKGVAQLNATLKANRQSAPNAGAVAATRLYDVIDRNKADIRLPKTQAMLEQRQASAVHKARMAETRRAAELEAAEMRQAQRAQHEERMASARMRRRVRDEASAMRQREAVDATVGRISSTVKGVASGILSGISNLGSALTGPTAGEGGGVAAMPAYTAQWASGPYTAAAGIDLGIPQQSVVAQPAVAAAVRTSGPVGQSVDENNPPPGHKVIVPSSAGYRVRNADGTGGKLLPYQRLALDAFAGETPGARPVRSLLVFHSMGSGKTPIVHAFLNYLAGVAGQSIEGVQRPASLACRVALLWQNEQTAREQKRSLEKNRYGIFAGYNKPEHDSGNIFFGTIDEKADIDELKTQLQIPSERWYANYKAVKKRSGAESEGRKEAGMGLEDLRQELRQIKADRTMMPSEKGRAVQGLQAEIAALTAQQAASTTGSETSRSLDAALRVWPCSTDNPVLFIVDECHKLFTDTNAAYPLLRTCVTCGHAKVALLSGTPVTSAEPLKEFVRLCMLLGGKEWIVAALELVEPPPRRASRRIQMECTYDALKAVMFGKGGLHVTRSEGVTKKAWAEHMGKTHSTLESLNQQLADAEAAVMAHIAAAAAAAPKDASAETKAVDALIAKTPRLNISYYGRINGNVVAHERFRDDFASYDFSAIADLLRRTHVASVPGSTHVWEGKHDENFEEVGGEMFTRTVDGKQYAVVDGRVVYQGADATALPGPPAHTGVWHSVREFVPAFLPNRRIRCLHACVPPWFRHTYIDEAGKSVPLDKFADGYDAHDMYVYDHTFAWLRQHMRVTDAWDKASRESKEYFMRAGHSAIYEMVCALAVVYVTACACVFESDAEHRTNLVVYIDRSTYNLSRAQLELLIYAVFDGSMGHKLHEETQHPGVPYAGADTKKDGRLTFQVGWETTVASGARTLSQWLSAFGKPPPPAARKSFEPDAEATRRAVESFGQLFALDMQAALRAATNRTTMWEEELRSDVGDQRASKSYMSLHVLFRDMFVTEANGESLSTEGDDLGMFGGLFILNLPMQMTSQRLEQLFDRINRVNTAKTTKTKTKKFIMCTTRPDVLDPGTPTPLRMMGRTAKDRLVKALNETLVRYAGDCAKMRTDAESAAFLCTAVFG